MAKYINEIKKRFRETSFLGKIILLAILGCLVGTFIFLVWNIVFVHAFYFEKITQYNALIIGFLLTILAEITVLDYIEEYSFWGKLITLMIAGLFAGIPIYLLWNFVFSSNFGWKEIEISETLVLSLVVLIVVTILEEKTKGSKSK